MLRVKNILNLVINVISFLFPQISKCYQSFSLCFCHYILILLSVLPTLSTLLSKYCIILPLEVRFHQGSGFLVFQYPIFLVFQYWSHQYFLFLFCYLSFGCCVLYGCSASVNYDSRSVTLVFYSHWLSTSECISWVFCTQVSWSQYQHQKLSFVYLMKHLTFLLAS